MTDRATHPPVTVLASHRAVSDASGSPARTRRPAALRVGPVKHCPSCGTELDGGPIVFDCRTCERSVRAADIDTEFHAPVRRAA